MENELGYPLFERSHKGVVLTSYGEKTLEIAVDVLKQLERLKLLRYQYDHTEVSTLSGRLTITAIITISLELMQRVIPAFSSAYPEVELVIIERNSLPALEDVRQGRSDMGFLSLKPGELTEEYEAVPLWTEKLYALVNSQSDLARKTSVSLKQISRCPLAIMAFDQNDHSVYEELFAKAKLQPKIVMRSSNFELTQRHILQNNSVGLAFIASVKDPHRTFFGGNIRGADRRSGTGAVLYFLPQRQSQAGAYRCFHSGAAGDPLVEFLQKKDRAGSRLLLRQKRRIYNDH